MLCYGHGLAYIEVFFFVATNISWIWELLEGCHCADSEVVKHGETIWVGGRWCIGKTLSYVAEETLYQFNFHFRHLWFGYEYTVAVYPWWLVHIHVACYLLFSTLFTGLVANCCYESSVRWITLIDISTDIAKVHIILLNPWYILLRSPANVAWYIHCVIKF